MHAYRRELAVLIAWVVLLSLLAALAPSFFGSSDLLGGFRVRGVLAL